MEKKNNGNSTHRVITFLNRGQIDFIDKWSKDFMFNTGTKLPRTKIIAMMVDAFMKMGINISAAHSIGELQHKIFEYLDHQEKEIENVSETEQ